MAEVRILQSSLPVLDPKNPHSFIKPKKEINDGHDVTCFLASTAYRDIWSFLFQLNTSMFPQQPEVSAAPRVFELTSPDHELPSSVERLRALLKELGSIIDEVPPDTGPRRFGNISFRRWYEVVQGRLDTMLDNYLPREVLVFGNPVENELKSKDELEAYLLGSFGSAQRLDYGTGHELSFLAFLASIWKLGGFPASENGDVERAIVLGVIEPYLQLIRRLILTYTLEPAGSHGVWGLDDHSFIPYIFGSAQLSPPIRTPADIPTEGSLNGAPNPSEVAKKLVVERERKTNMYFSAIGFINDVKKGPFWEHSPILYDVSGVKAGWAKINKGMIKMYNAEVLSKFPVVQHFPFGSLFRWERDPNSAAVAQTIHISNQPTRIPAASSHQSTRDPMQQGTRAPWTSNTAGASTTTAAPWGSGTSARTAAPPPVNMPTRAPGASHPGPAPSGSEANASIRKQPSETSAATAESRMAPTQAPWARKPPVN